MCVLLEPVGRPPAHSPQSPTSRHPIGILGSNPGGVNANFQKYDVFIYMEPKGLRNKGELWGVSWRQGRETSEARSSAARRAMVRRSQAAAMAGSGKSWCISPRSQSARGDRRAFRMASASPGGDEVP